MFSNVLVLGNLHDCLVIDGGVRIKGDDIFKPLDGLWNVISPEVPVCNHIFVFSQNCPAFLYPSLCLQGEGAVRISANEPGIGLNHLVGTCLIPVRGVHQVVIAASYLKNNVGNRLVCGMEIFKVLVKGNCLLIKALVVLAVGKTKFSNGSVRAEGVPVPDFFEFLFCKKIPAYFKIVHGLCC